MKLKTDYVQFYDHVFDEALPVFHRMAFTPGGLSKGAQFDLFARLGLNTPPHGTVQDLAARHRHSCPRWSAPAAAAENVHCVVYLDEYAHRGEGKVLLSLSEAAAKYPGALASMFYPQREAPVAFRHVRFGGLGYWLRQRGGPAGWRSNVADQEEVLAKEEAPAACPVPRVLWAIDFIPSPTGLLAVDFNTAPDLTTLGETGALSAAEAQRELLRAATDRPLDLAQF